MSEYTPDRWVVLNINNTIHKILSGWYGGYLDGDSWRLSSGITKIIKHLDHLEIHNESGSIYYCYLSNYGTTSYTDSILNDWKSQADSRNILIEMIDYNTLLNLYGKQNEY